MRETQIPEISIDELMEKIRAEVNLRKKEKENSGQSFSRSSFDSEDVPFPRIRHLNLEFLENAKPVDIKQNKYHINSFLKYYGNDFVQNCYRGILKRDPDPDGLQNFLNKLMQGKMTSIEIIGRLRYSDEGKKIGVRVTGLFCPFLIHSSFRIPVLGYFIRLFTGIFQLPTLIRNFQNLDAHVHLQSARVQGYLKQTLTGIQGRINRTIDVYGYSLDNLANEKADRDEVETWLTEKADTVFVEQLEKQKMDGEMVKELLLQKADRDEVETWLTEKADTVFVEQLEKQKMDGEMVKELLLQKADRDEVETWLTEKADTAFVKELENSKASKSDLDILSSQKADKTEAVNILRQILDHKRNILDQERRLRILLAEAKKRFPDPISRSQIQEMVNEENHFLDAMYASFEDQFRGTRDDIKNRQSVYLSYIKEIEAGRAGSPIIDIGCGRGEWLELLKEQGFVAKGVEANRVLAEECRDRGLSVTLGEGVAVLREEKREAYGGVTGFHMVEHLPLNALIAFFDESFRVLKPGGIIIFETPNPDNILVGCRNFYIDPTHQKPIPSTTLRSIAEARGFQNTEILRLHPTPYYSRDETVKEPLKSLLYGPQDYALIGYKL